ncbi:MAG: 3-hydroxyacyl-[acyl-carrier-protein] dehydratase FabZ [Elusimicrobia bacterium CG06_land_8_20_14_3_00_38_11]|nr:MAG: 3-hydroxyacyl-[acyl-carrier-protein] dehydratase FabZ [Elusimicrobia bacterium CG06_land_8_20_14_3_00_38_11]
MGKQKTISKEVSYSGTGLHTGNNVSIKLKPATENMGIIFVRCDLPDNPKIKADISNVLTTVRGTTVGLDEKTSVHTVEHLLAALFAFGIDNLIIEMNSNEPPIADGSALPFVELIKKAGIIELQNEKKCFNLSETVVYKNDDVLITASPSNRFHISCTIIYNHPLLKNQFLSLDITPEIFEKEIAPARTFCFDYEIEALKNKGLAKGGSLENAVVIGAKKILTKLRFEDEFVRHKILDLIGDISLLESSLKMDVTAVKCGHKNNVEFAKKLISTQNVQSLASAKSSSLWQIPDGKMIDINEIKATIPHRFPFLFVDKVILVEEVKRAVGIKNVSAGEPFFQGHFPEQAIMPGVLIIEALAQTACVLLLSKPELKSKKLAYFMSINNVKFRKPVFPGDTLYLDVEVLKAKQTRGIVRGCAFVDGKPVTEAEFSFVLVDKP